jgi:hypothetical protein
VLRGLQREFFVPRSSPRRNPEAGDFLLTARPADYMSGAMPLSPGEEALRKRHWDLSLIDEIQKSGFLDQLYRR